MARGRAAEEGLDDDHAAAATWTWRLVVIRSIGIGGFAWERWPSEQFAGARDVVGAGGLCQQAVVADAMEALGQDVDEESADELVCGKCHPLVSISALAPVVLPLEGDAVLVECDQAAIGDGNAVGIAGEIGQHRLGGALNKRPIRSCAAAPDTRRRPGHRRAEYDCRRTEAVCVLR